MMIIFWYTFDFQVIQNLRKMFFPNTEILKYKENVYYSFHPYKCYVNLKSADMSILHWDYDLFLRAWHLLMSGWGGRKDLDSFHF